MSLTFERVRLMKLGTTETKDYFHVFDRDNPRVLLARTDSLVKAQQMIAGKLPLKNDVE